MNRVINDKAPFCIKDKVFSEQVRILHNNLLISVPANFACALVVFISLFDSPSSYIVSVWFAAVTVVSLFRMYIAYDYRRKPENKNPPLFIFLTGVVLSGALWGAINSVFMPEDDLIHQMVIIILTAGVTAGGIQTLNANLKASLIYLAIIAGPLCIWFFAQGLFIYILLGITMIVYISFMAVTSIRGNKLLATTLSLQYENQELIEKISVSNTKLSEYSKTLYELSIHDPLTGLFNRRYLNDTLSRELQRSQRENRPLCVAMLDLDYFKSFNDTHGHAAGDEMIKFVGELLQDTFRGSDISCRFGGEEFLVVLLNSDLSSAVFRLEQFRLLVKKGKVFFKDKVLPAMTVSIGVAEASEQEALVNDIIHAADTALYAAKEAGRDRVQVRFLSS